MNERDFYIDAKKIAQHIIKKTCVIEVKLVKDSDRFYFKNIPDHQTSSLLAAKHGSLAYKIPDEGLSVKPADIVFFTESNGYVMIIFLIKKKKSFYIIDIDLFQNHRENVNSVFISIDDCEQLSEFKYYK